MTTRAALIGTAPTWSQCPFDDPSLHIVSLNDAYSLGVPRADAWYDIHPMERMWFRPKGKTTFVEGEIPEGTFVRPEGHLEWLKEKAKSIPIWLQADAPRDWPVNAKRFPFEDVKAFLKARPDQEAYIASSPAEILAHLVLQGFTEIHIYGIHLATQAEYLKQRPNFEWLLGKVEAMGVNIVLPPECPLLKHTHVYGHEPEPQRPDLPALKRQKQLQAELNKVANDLIVWPRWKSKEKPLQQLARLKAELRDAQQQARHAVVSAGV
ncbi:MAG TPA: hypothetical protein VEA16_02435 [Vicinamibacterales bacterium]|nr:hypothetical protein [Vicinamibacterales bacterium]